MPRILSKRYQPEEALYESLDLNSDRVTRLMAWLTDEHRKAIAAHSDYFEELRLLRRAIKAKPNTRVKTFPWPGASNIVVPLIRIAGDAVKARIVNTLLAPKPFWICTAAAPSSRYAPYARPVQNFMDWAVNNDLKIEDWVDAIADQVVYLGKCPVKVSYKEVVKKVRTYNRKTRQAEDKIKTVASAPWVEPILLENWLEPWGIGDPLSKPWSSQQVFKRAGDLKEMEKQGLIKNSSKVMDLILQSLPADVQERDELHRLTWAETEIATLYETHCQYDIDDDGFQEELIVLWSYRGEGIPLYVKYNFFFHGNRPHHLFFYMRDSDNRSTGDGLAQMLWPLQEALSTFVNQRTDNITIANTRFFKGKKGVVKKGDAIWPGKVMLMDEPSTDLMAEKLGDVSPQSFQHESIIRDYAERLSGISDPQLGREFDNPRVAATTTLSILQEGNRRFDMIVRLMRKEFSIIGQRTFQLYQQFGVRVKIEDILSPEDELYVRELLDESPEAVEQNFLVQVNTSTATENLETQRQGMTQLYTTIVGFYQEVNTVAANVIANPQIPEPLKDLIIEMADKSYNILKEIVISYNITNPDDYLANVGDALRAIKDGGSPSSFESDFSEGLARFGGVVNNSGGGIPAGEGGAVPSPTRPAGGEQGAGAGGGGAVAGA